MSSSTDKMAGKGKQMLGKATDNTELQMKGKMQEMKGDATAKAKDVHDKLVG